MVLGLAGRALIGGGKLLLKGGAKAAPKGAKLATGIFSGAKNVLTRGGKGIADRGRKVAAGAQSTRTPINPWKKFGYNSSEFGKTILPALREGGEGAARELGKLWTTIAAKYPNKAEALRQFTQATSKLGLGTKGQSSVNAASTLIKGTANSVKDAATPLFQTALRKASAGAGKGRDLRAIQLIDLVEYNEPDGTGMYDEGDF